MILGEKIQNSLKFFRIHFLRFRICWIFFTFKKEKKTILLRTGGLSLSPVYGISATLLSSNILCVKKNLLSVFCCYFKLVSCSIYLILFVKMHFQGWLRPILEPCLVTTRNATTVLLLCRRGGGAFLAGVYEPCSSSPSPMWVKKGRTIM